VSPYTKQTTFPHHNPSWPISRVTLWIQHKANNP